MKSLLKLLLLFLIIFFISPEAAQAHNIGGIGLASGITHPLLGLDHLLAMIAVGIVSTQLGGKAIWKVPATFVSFMILGALLAITGLGLPIAETGIALSMLVLGIAIALSKNTSIKWAMLCIALFAIFHGHSHGEELPLIANPALYTIGFVLSTISLHISGVLVGHYAQQRHWTHRLLRFAGAGIGMMGLVFLLGV